jgi:lipopolysaccharide biosynthesis glycosyltransferase
MVSVVENNKNKNICFHLMVDESFDAEIIEHIEQKITSKLVEVKFYKIHKINNKTLGPVTTAGYYRLLTPNLFPNLDRVIYIDDDIICNGDITAL